MFLFGPNQQRDQYNFRPALHDSNGLAIHTGSGEWLWRPLNNPRNLAISTFQVTNPKGFGLLQLGTPAATSGCSRQQGAWGGQLGHKCPREGPSVGLYSDGVHRTCKAVPEPTDSAGAAIFRVTDKSPRVELLPFDTA